MNQKNSQTSNSTPKPYPETSSSSAATGKVSESVAAYGYIPAKKAVSPQHFIAGVAVADEVWRFAVMNELTAHLETAVKLVRQLFLKLGEIRFSYEIDPEIENEPYIMIRAKVQGELDELARADWSFTEEILRAVPKDKVQFIHFFPIVG